MSEEEAVLRERSECAATVRAMARYWPGAGLEWAARAIEARSVQNDGA